MCDVIVYNPDIPSIYNDSIKRIIGDGLTLSKYESWEDQKFIDFVRNMIYAKHGIPVEVSFDKDEEADEYKIDIREVCYNLDRTFTFNIYP